MKKTNIREKFENFIREKLTDDEFWAWIRSWMDVETLVDMAMEWEDDVMAEEIATWEAEVKEKKKYLKWLDKNEDGLREAYGFDVHEAGREEKLYNITTFADYAKGVYEQEKEDGEL